MNRKSSEQGGEVAGENPWVRHCSAMGPQRENLQFSTWGMTGVRISSLLWSQFRKAAQCLLDCLQDEKQKWVFQWSVYNISQGATSKEKKYIFLDYILRILFCSQLLVSVLKHFSSTIWLFSYFWFECVFRFCTLFKDFSCLLQQEKLQDTGTGSPLSSKVTVCLLMK